MKKMLIGLAAAAGLVLAASTALANSPAPWWACEGLAEGDGCDAYRAPFGVCVLQEECEDDPTTEGLNECLWCEGSATAACSMAASPVSAVFFLQALAVVVGLTLFLRRRRSR